MLVVQRHARRAIVLGLERWAEDAPQHDDEGEHEEHESDFGVPREAGGAHNVGQLHGRPPVPAPRVTTSLGGSTRMSLPKRCRYAMMATISFFSRPCGPPCATIAAATCDACSRAMAGARLTASP